MDSLVPGDSTFHQYEKQGNNRHLWFLSLWFSSDYMTVFLEVGISNLDRTVLLIDLLTRMRKLLLSRVNHAYVKKKV